MLTKNAEREKKWLQETKPEWQENENLPPEVAILVGIFHTPSKINLPQCVSSLAYSDPFIIHSK